MSEKEKIIREIEKKLKSASEEHLRYLDGYFAGMLAEQELKKKGGKNDAAS